MRSPVLVQSDTNRRRLAGRKRMNRKYIVTSRQLLTQVQQLPQYGMQGNYENQNDPGRVIEQWWENPYNMKRLGQVWCIVRTTVLPTERREIREDLSPARIVPHLHLSAACRALIDRIPASICPYPSHLYPVMVVIA